MSNKAAKLMTEDITIHLADNGIMMTGEEFVQVIEDTHNTDGIGHDHVIKELGKLLHDDIMCVADNELTNIIKVRIEITGGDNA